MPLMILGPLGLPTVLIFLSIYIWSIYYHILSIYYHLYSHIPSNLCTFYWRKSLCARNTRQSFSNFGTELGTLLSRLAPEAQPVSRWDEKNMIATFINIRGMYIYSVYYVYIYKILYIYIYTYTRPSWRFRHGWGRDGIMCVETCIYMCPHTVWAKLRKTFRQWRPEYHQQTWENFRWSSATLWQVSTSEALAGSHLRNWTSAVAIRCIQVAVIFETPAIRLQTFRFQMYPSLSGQFDRNQSLPVPGRLLAWFSGSSALGAECHLGKWVHIHMIPMTPMMYFYIIKTLRANSIQTERCVIRNVPVRVPQIGTEAEPLKS